MRTVCQALDILQSESKAFLGTFLPTIAMAFKKLKELKSSHNIGVCLPLIDTLCEALAKRFGHYFEDESCLLASSFHPQFRLSWLPWFFDEPLEVENRLKRKMSDILVAADSAAETSSSDEGTSYAFFGCLFTQQKRRKSSNADRVETFLYAVPPKSIDANSFDDEGLKKLFIQYNILPYNLVQQWRDY